MKYLNCLHVAVITILCFAVTSAQADLTHAVAVMNPTKGNTAKGVVHFAQKGDKVEVTAKISGLTPNAKHAIHIHEFGDPSSGDGKSAGGHYNPEGHDHALPSSSKRHAGDLGNLEADSKGNATFSFTADNISIAGAKNAILGRGMIIHAKADDGGQPTGNAGARISCGVIGIAKASAATASAGGKIVGKVAEAGCGKCVYKISGVSSCSTRLSLDGKYYEISGDVIPHGKVCGGKASVKVTGEIKGNTFASTKMEVN